MTIQEKCAVVDALLTRFEAAKKKQTLADALNKRTTELEEVETPFLAVMSSIRILREGAILTDARLPNSSKVTERASSMRDQLALEPQDVTKGQSFNLLCRAVKSLTEESESLATASWSEYVRSQSPVVDKTLLDQHRDSPKHGTAVVEIEQLVQGLKLVVKKPPQDSTALQMIREQWARIARILSTMPVSDDPEVQAFLNAATKSEGAALALFTPSVERWLMENSMVSDFCIRRSR